MSEHDALKIYQTFPAEGFRGLTMVDPLSRDRCWRQLDGDTPIAAQWLPPRVRFLRAEEYADPDYPYLREPPRWNGDFPSAAGLPLVFTTRSLSVLRGMLESHVEFLPLWSAEGEFTVVRALRIIDALDKERSIIDWRHQTKRAKEALLPRTASRVIRYVFRDELLAGVPIFRLPELASCLYWFVTEDFRRAVVDSGLRGLGFRLLWPPLDPEVKFAKYIEKHRRKRR